MSVKSRRVWAVVLSLVMLMGILPMDAIAAAAAKITRQPKTISVNLNEEGTFTIRATNAKAYRWQKSSNGTKWTNISGATGNSYTLKATANAAKLQYRCAVTGKDGEKIYSRAVKLKVIYPDPEITLQPVGVDVTYYGESVTFSAKATYVKSYQWQSRTEGGAWTAISGATKANYTLGANAAAIGKEYRCRITGKSGAKINTEVVSINMTVPDAVITQQPTVPESTFYNETITLAVAADNAASYQWQSKAEGGKWTAISGATEASYALTVTTKTAALQYRCVVTGINKGTKASVAVQPNGVYRPSEISEQPESVEDAKYGQEITFSVTANAVKSYQWQSKVGEDGEWENIEDATKRTYTFTLNKTNAKATYRVVVRGKAGNRVDSDEVTITMIAPDVKITLQPVAPEQACYGDDVTLTVEAENAQKYQWQSKVDGAWKNIRGATKATYTFTGETDSPLQYRCLVTGINGSTATSRVVTLTLIKKTVKITRQPKSVENAYYGNAVKFNVRATGVKTYQWQQSDDGETWKNVTGAKSATLSMTVDGAQAAMYRCKLVGSNKHTVFTDVVTLTLAAPDVVITLQPVDTGIIPDGDSVTLETAAENAASFQWQKQSGAQWISVEGATEAAYTFAVIEQTAGVYRCEITGLNKGKWYTNEVKVDIQYYPVELTLQPVNFVSNYEDVVTFTVDGNHVGRWQWQSSQDGETWTNIDGANGKEYTVTVAADVLMLQYRCALIGNGPDNTVYTNVVGITLTYPDVHIRTSPVSQTIIQDQPVTFAVAVENENYVRGYQWQSSANGADWANIEGETAATLTFTVTEDVPQGMSYRCVVSGKNNGKAISDPAVLTIQAPPAEILTQPVNVENAYYDVPAVFTVKAKYAAAYQWQTSADGLAWIDMAGETAAALTVQLTKANVNNLYRCVITGRDEVAVTSSAAQAILAYPDLEIIIQPAVAEFNFVGDEITLMVEATNVEGYQWQTSADGAAWANIDGATTVTYTFIATADARYRCQLLGLNHGAEATNVIDLVLSPAEMKYFTYTAQPDGGYALGAYTGTETELTVPTHAPNGEPITAIADECFKDNATLTAITLHEGIKAIGANAFANCAAQTITLYDTVKTVDASAFAGAAAKVIINAKQDAAITALLDAIEAQGLTYEILSANGQFAYKRSADKAGAVLAKYKGSAEAVTVPATLSGMPVVQIGQEAFYRNTTMKKIDLPDTIEIIGVRAFAGCTALEEME